MTNYSYRAGFEFRQKLKQLINKLSLENGSDTPDFILASYLDESLQAFDRAVDARTKWFGPPDSDKEPRTASHGPNAVEAMRERAAAWADRVYGDGLGNEIRALPLTDDPTSPECPESCLGVPSCPADIVGDSLLQSMNRTAHLAYNVYGDSVRWKNYAGLPMPQWEDLPRRIRASWCLTTQAIETEARSDD